MVRITWSVCDVVPMLLHATLLADEKPVPVLPHSALSVPLCRQAYREWDFSNMLTVLLRFNNRPVAAAVVRVFGQQLAELPLVATRPDARRQGHARVMVRAIEATLMQLGVKVRERGHTHEQPHESAQ